MTDRTPMGISESLRQFIETLVEEVEKLKENA